MVTTQPNIPTAPIEARPPAPAVPPGSPGSAGPPRLADGVELLGLYEDSGFKEPPYLVRRPDGQMITLSRLLYLIAEKSDGHSDAASVAEAVSAEYGKHLSSEQAASLIKDRLRPLGVLAASDGSSPQLRRNEPALALKFRAAVIPTGLVNGIASGLRPLFWPPVVLAVLGLLGAFDFWLFARHGLAQPVRNLLQHPEFFLVVFGLVVASAAFHECGHATACRYGGAKPGVMGAGLYIVWPAFYTDVTDAYRLGRGGRLRTDLGGVYFNTIFILGTAAAYYLTHVEALLVLIAVQHLEIVHQFMPSLRLDGYYVVADLTGVPDLFGRIKPVLLSLIPFRKTDPRVAELRARVRVAVTLWVLVSVPVILYIYAMLIINMPRIFATAWQTVQKLLAQAGAGLGHGNIATVLFALLQVLLLTLPLLGIVLAFGGAIRRLGVGAWHRTEGRPALRVGLLTASGAVAVAAFLLLGPRGNYRPLRPSDRGTIASATESVVNAPADFAQGRPLGSGGSDSGTPSRQPAGQTNTGGGLGAPAAAPLPSAAAQASPTPAATGSPAPVSASPSPAAPSPAPSAPVSPTP